MICASSVRGENLFQVKAIYHRNDPIILGNPPGRPPYAVGTMATCFARAGQIKAELQKAGVPDVVDVDEKLKKEVNEKWGGLFSS